MKLYHQTGHNFTWDIDSYIDDKTGDGLIFSPLNISYSKLESFPLSIRVNSLFDPQLFMPSNNNKELPTYPYFPSSIIDAYKSSDYEKIKNEIAKRYVEMIVKLGFKKIIIPNRYSDIESSSYFETVYSNFIKPHCDEITVDSDLEKYLTIIINKTKLIDDEFRDSMLDWITGLSEIDGVYLIFDIKRTSKQIKEPDTLAESLFFIKAIEASGKNVIIGFTSTEGMLFSIANPQGITCGSYENLRNFNMSITRFAPKVKKEQRGPNARLYSACLFQWIEYTYVLALLKNKYSRINEVFPESKYRPLFFEPTYKWYFSKAELYKHYFIEMSKQVKALPDDLDTRKKYIISSVKKAISIYDDIKQNGILFDSESDDSHLYGWLNSITIYDKLVGERL